jgi:hypothetical protein
MRDKHTIGKHTATETQYCKHRCEDIREALHKRHTRHAETQFRAEDIREALDERHTAVRLAATDTYSTILKDIREALEERHSATEESVNCDEWELRYKRMGEGKRINVKGRGGGGGGGGGEG